MLNTNPSRTSQSTKLASLLNSFREKLFSPNNSVLEIDLNVCEEFLQKEETPKSDSNFSSQTFRKWNGKRTGSSHTLFLRPEPSVQKLKRQTTEIGRFVRMDLRAKQRPSIWGTMTLLDGLELLQGKIRVAAGDRRQRTEDRGQKTEDRGQKAAEPLGFPSESKSRGRSSFNIEKMDKGRGPSHDICIFVRVRVFARI